MIIHFTFPLENTHSIPISAMAEAHHSDLYYVVHSFYRTDVKDKNDFSLLPQQEVMQINQQGKTKWVHRDSQKETLLSKIIGKAIENALAGSNG